MSVITSNKGNVKRYQPTPFVVWPMSIDNNATHSLMQSRKTIPFFDGTENRAAQVTAYLVASFARSRLTCLLAQVHHVLPTCIKPEESAPMKSVRGSCRLLSRLLPRHCLCLLMCVPGCVALQFSVLRIHPERDELRV